MRTLTFNVPPDCEGITVGRFLRSRCGASARLITRQKQVPMGITCNGEHIRTVDLLHAGDVVALNIPDDKKPAEAIAIPIIIAYEDDDLAVLEKPANMAVHPSHNHQGDTLANAFAAHTAQAGSAATFRPINRLDRDTTGLVAVCKHSHAANQLHGHLQKVYYAVCEGELSGSGTIDAPIRRVEGAGIRREVGEGGQRCVTHWQALASAEGLTLLRIILETGRTHQIRCHFSCYMGMPLTGDDMYGGHRELIARQALHCGQLDFIHPETGQPVRVTSPLPEDMASLPPCVKAEAQGLLLLQ